MNDTSTPPTGQDDPASGPRVTRDEMADVRRMRRPHDRMVAGVAAGVARHFDVDPLVVRVAFAVLSFFGGAGLLLYVAGWLLLPEDGAEDAPLPLDDRSRSIALVGALALGAVAVVGNSAGLYWFPWPLIVLGVIGWFLYDRSQRQARQQAPAPSPQPYEQPYDQPYVPQVYEQPYEATTPYAWTAPPAPPPPTRQPRDPRRRGPVLFGFTLALVALSLGVLGTVDLAGVAVADSAYPALALAVVAVMLVVGAFWGRAGGLITLAIIAAVTTIGTMAAEGWEHERASHAPVTASEVRENYEMRSGELVIDLGGISDLEELDGRRVRADLGVGSLRVVVPAGARIDVTADVGVGTVRLVDGVEHSGLGISRTTTEGPSDGPRVTLDLDTGVGEVAVQQVDRPDSGNGGNENDDSSGNNGTGAGR